MKKRNDLEEGLESQRPNYPQPHNIHITPSGNPALDDKQREYFHARAKYQAKYGRSKQTKRLY